MSTSSITSEGGTSSALLNIEHALVVHLDKPDFELMEIDVEYGVLGEFERILRELLRLDNNIRETVANQSQKSKVRKTILSPKEISAHLTDMLKSTVGEYTSIDFLKLHEYMQMQTAKLFEEKSKHSDGRFMLFEKCGDHVILVDTQSWRQICRHLLENPN